VVVLAAEVPLNVTVAPLPAGSGVTVPEIVKVGTAAIVKSTAATLAPATVTDRLAGVIVKPALVAVTV
jgi:hypothetical protein